MKENDKSGTTGWKIQTIVLAATITATISLYIDNHYMCTTDIMKSSRDKLNIHYKYMLEYFFGKGDICIVEQGQKG